MAREITQFSRIEYEAFLKTEQAETKEDQIDKLTPRELWMWKLKNGFGIATPARIESLGGLKNIRTIRVMQIEESSFTFEFITLFKPEELRAAKIKAERIAQEQLQQTQTEVRKVEQKKTPAQREKQRERQDKDRAKLQRDREIARKVEENRRKQPVVEYVNKKG